MCTRKKHKKVSRLRPFICVVFGLAVLVAGIVLVQKFVNNDPAQPALNPIPMIEHGFSNGPEFAALSEIPARLSIAKINVDNASIEPVGLTTEGNMDTPATLNEIGWYDQSSKAGESRYSVLLDGHYGTDENPGVFYRLGELAAGDEINLLGSDGSELVYKVVEVETAPFERIDMKRALMPYSPVVQSLTIITCDGTFDRVNQTYDRRTVVYAERFK